MDNRFKIDFYDDFKCIADQCTFSCCKGWEVSVDRETWDKWRADETNPACFFKNIKTGKQGGKPEYAIKLRSGKECPFLDEAGLCNIVKEHGDDYLPKTCRSFPRLESSVEYSLSCACPSVVDLMNGREGKIRLINAAGPDCPGSSSSVLRIRDGMLALIQDERFTLENRILLIFHMLLSWKEEQELSEEAITGYLEGEFLQSLTDQWSEIEIEAIASLQETNELFQDITRNYRKEKCYRSYLQDIYELAGKPDTGRYFDQSKAFRKVLDQYGQLLENFLALKIFSDCTGSSPDELLMSFQLIITQYLMVRHSMLLKWLPAPNAGQAADYTDLKNYIVVYSRIIGYNEEGIREFWEESFDEAVWAFGYLLLLMNERQADISKR